MQQFTSTIAQLPQFDIRSSFGVVTALAVLGWALVLLRRIRDRHMRIVVGLVGLVATYQGLSLALETRGWIWFADALGVICCVGAIIVLERMVRKYLSAQCALRLSEAREMVAHSTPRLDGAALASQSNMEVPSTILHSAPMICSPSAWTDKSVFGTPPPSGS